MPSEWIIVAVIGLVLLFSANKLPDMARGLGQSLRIVKSETRGLRGDDDQSHQAVENQRPAPADRPAPAASRSGPADDDSRGVAGSHAPVPNGPGPHAAGRAEQHQAAPPATPGAASPSG